MSAYRAPLLPGVHDAADARTSTAARRSWLRNMNTGRKPPSCSASTLRVVVNLALLLLLLLLLQNRSKHYLQNKKHYSQAISTDGIRHSSMLASAGDVVADSTWMPPAWVGEPPAVDPLACTPQLLVIGGMKCGTTALFHYLNGTVPRTPKAAKQKAAKWVPPTFGDDQQFLNGTPASAEYCDRYFHLPDEQRRFHPQMIGSIVTKEVHFFDQEPTHVKAHLNQYFAKFAGVNMSVDNPSAGICSYPQQLGLSSSSPPALVRLEATVMYMPTRTAARLVKEILPNTRLVAMLREPVTRALSSINMVIQRGDFLELKVLDKNTPAYGKVWREVVVRELRKEMTQISHCFAQAGSASGQGLVEHVDACVLGYGNTLTSPHQFAKLSERVLDIHLGLYALHLQRWFNAGFAPQQLLIWSTKAFKENPWHHMQQLVKWLGLDPAKCRQQGDFLKMHKRTYPDGTLPKGFLQEIAAFYEPHNQQLFQLLMQQGYHEVVQQLRKAWPLELAATVEKLEEKVPAAA